MPKSLRFLLVLLSLAGVLTAIIQRNLVELGLLGALTTNIIGGIASITALFFAVKHLPQLPERTSQQADIEMYSYLKNHSALYALLGWAGNWSAIVMFNGYRFLLVNAIVSLALSAFWTYCLQVPEQKVEEKGEDDHDEDETA